MTLADKVAEYRLVKNRRRDVHGKPYRNKALNKIGWDHEISQPQGGEEHFRERAHIDHSSGRIKTLQAADRQAVKAVFTVVVILNDPGSRGLCPLEQLKSPRSAHRDAGRILMR